MHGLAASRSTNLKLWHQRLRHLSMQLVKTVLKAYAQQGYTGEVDMANAQQETEPED
jgi:hypothetical protein